MLSLLIFLMPAVSSCMEAPVQEEAIPLALQSEYTKEQKQLRKYNLENPEVFLKLLREDLGQEKDLSGYLEQLQIMTSSLLAQHLAMQILDEIAYLKNKFNQTRDQFYMVARKLAKTRVSQFEEEIELVPDNSAQLNEVLAHIDLVKNPKILTEDELKIVFSMILDSSKGEWINNLGKYLILHHDGILIDDLIAEKQSHLADIFTAANKSPIMQSHNPLIAEIRKYLDEALSNLSKYRELLNNPKYQTPQKKEISTVDFFRNNQRIAHLYRLTQKWYAQIYKIVRKELYDSFGKLAKKGVKNIAGYLTPIPENARKEGVFPNKFPEELILFQEASKTVALPSVDKQFEQARIEWEKTQAQAPKIKKKYRRKKTAFPSISVPGIEEEKEEAAPIKIRTGADGSYIVQGGEDDIQITIEDPIHDAVATIFKTKQTPANAAQLKQLPKINYTPWVKIWFNDPEKARIEQGYTDPKNPKFKAGEPNWKPIVLHAFAQLVDEYIGAYGTVGQTPSRSQRGKNDILVTIPGKMEFPDGSEETGVFTYIIDSATGHWYHRMFTPESGKKLIADLFEKGYFSPEMTGYYNVFFPSLPAKKE